MLALVLDDTGTHDGSQFCSCVGIVAGLQHWKRFDREWKTALEEAGVTDLHARRFFARDKGRNRVGLYRGWSDEKADRFLRKILALFGCMKAKVFGVTVETEVFNRLSEPERAFLTGQLVHLEDNQRTLGTGAPNKPWLLAFAATTIQALDYGDKRVPMHVVMDQQESFSAWAQLLCSQINSLPEYRNLIRGFAAESRKHFVSLQLADLFAYSWNRYLSGAQISDEIDLVFERMNRKCEGMRLLNEEGIKIFQDQYSIELNERFAG